MSGPPRGRPHGRLASARGLVIDLEPLRLDPDFRRLWTGQAINTVGTQITRVALPYQVFVHTGSMAALAGLTLVQLVPLMLFSLSGGAIADAMDRRRVLIVTQLGLAATSLALAVLSIQREMSLPALFAVAFVAAGLTAVDWPTRTSAIPRLVPAHRLRSAISLGQLTFNGGAVLGPLVAGVLIGTVGAAGAFAADVASYAFSLAMLAGLRPIPPLGGSSKPGLAAIKEGLRFVRSRRLILATFAIDLNAMIFGMPTAVFPALALDVFKVGPVGLGLLNAAPAVGAFIGIAFSGALNRVRRIGRGIILAVVAWGAAIALFGLSTFFFPLALVFLAIAGAADVVSAVFRSSAVQMEAPDELRGRVAAINILVVTGGPRIGDIEAALVAAAIGAQLSVISGGLLCLLGVVGVVRAFPELDSHVSTIRAPAIAAADGAG